MLKAAPVKGFHESVGNKIGNSKTGLPFRKCFLRVPLGTQDTAR
jgi:hypothetical protein